MRADTARLDLRLRRRSLIGYTAGMALYAFTIVALYPSFRSDTSLNKLTDNGNPVAALFGAVGPLTSSTGWLNANIYANFLPLILLMMAIGYGSASIAGQDEDGTLGLVATLPLSRRRIMVEKLATMGLLAVPVAVVTLLCVLAGAGFELHFDIGHLVGVTVGVWLLAVDFGALAMLVGAATASRGTALGVTTAVAVAAYIVSSLAPVVHWIRPLRYSSPFFYAVGDGQLTRGLDPGWAAVLGAIAVVLSAAATEAFERLDVR